ncbi:MAG: class I SAM-dependent methyltransferase, partial [Gemmatimonadota bacterium]
DAKDLIAGAVLDDDGAPNGRRWADLGAGSGTFAFALSELLGPGAEIIAVDREPAAVDSLRRGLRGRAARSAGRARAGTAAPMIVPARGDFRDPDAIPELAGALDGALFANALHFDADPGATLAAFARRLPADGRLVVIEYRDRPPNPWVPHPLAVARLRQVAAAAGLGEPRVVGERPSSYGGTLYCAWMPPAPGRP